MWKVKELITVKTYLSQLITLVEEQIQQFILKDSTSKSKGKNQQFILKDSIKAREKMAISVFLNWNLIDTSFRKFTNIARTFK